MPGKVSSAEDGGQVAAPAAEPLRFSLFEGDRLNRVYRAIGLGRFQRYFILKRCLFVLLVTYVPLALLAWCEGLTTINDPRTNFFADFAAYIELLVALPLFILCEPIMDRRTREVAQELVTCKIIKPEDQHNLRAINARVEMLRKSIWPELICLFWAYFFSLTILIPEFQAGAKLTWHVRSDMHFWLLGTHPATSYTGTWEFLIALPILNYTWLRLGWKVLLWCYYLFRVTRMRLNLHPTHPDVTGGIGFISEAQGQFALFLLAFGLSNIAAPISYEIVVLHYDLTVLPVWGPLLGFAIGGPIVFTLPLFMFTRQLYNAKYRALAVYRERVTELSSRIETYWEPSRQQRAPHAPAEELRELAELTTLSTMFRHIETMRVVPLDWRSFGQLMGSSFGTIAAILPFLKFDENSGRPFELLEKLFGLFGGHGG